ncbi:VanZ family protein [Cohnella xylanilytica]|uniref:VanZ family protein n=1 Tax=Cohnella xylanilytica TaxID=557555 RepID=A0A841U1C7_9BACL|nr:VanZ family protein [Cohnella xylanilytica]MBB6693242.1 VanZ family protein [Cohnella xylanilytica]
MNVSRARSWRWAILVVLIGWLFVVFGFSSQPYQKQNLRPTLRRFITEIAAERIVPDITFRYHNGIVSGEQDPYGFMEFIIRKCAHLFEYGMLGILCYLLLFLIKKRVWRFGAALVLVATAALADEWNQSYVAERTSAIQDVGVDLAGAIVAISLFLLVKRLVWGKMDRRMSNKQERK